MLEAQGPVPDGRAGLSEAAARTGRRRQVVPDESACKQAQQAVGASSNPETVQNGHQDSGGVG